jgi:hypothetical protein
MRRLTALAMVAVATVLAAAPASAQGQGRRGRGGFGQNFSILQLTPPLETKLAITPTQKTEIDKLRMAVRQEVQAAFQGGGDRQAAMEKIRMVNMKAEADAVALLNGDQKTKYAAMKEESTKYRGLGRYQVGLLGVDLKPEQKAGLVTLAAEREKAREALMQSLQGGDRQANGEKMRAFQMETDAAVGKILTPEQLKEAQAAAPQPGRRGGGNNNNN